MRRKSEKSLDDLYSTKVSHSEIMYLMKKMTRRHDEGSFVGFEAAAFVLAERYRGKRNGIKKTFAIMERMNALASLMKNGDERLHGWTMDTDDPKCMLTHDAMFKATAICPLNIDEKQRAYFDADEFFEIVLKEADSEASA